MIGQLFAKIAAFFVNHTVAAVATSVVVCSAVAVPTVMVVNNIVEESQIEAEQSSILEDDILQNQEYEVEENSANSGIGTDSQFEEKAVETNSKIEEKQEVVDSQLEESSVHVHEYTVESVQATCVENGIETYTCQCGDSYTEEVEATGHDYGLAEEKAPSCTDAGYQKFVCEKCGDSYIEATDAVGHTYVVTEESSPTCETTGYQIVTCSDCGYSYTEELSVSDHIYDEWAVVVKPTEVKEGMGIRRCIWCGSSQTRAIPKNESHVHDWGNWSISIPPTEESEGERVRWCACGAADTEVIPRVGVTTETEPGHEHDYYRMGEVLHTCLEGGYTIFACACGNSYNDWFTDPMGHYWSLWEVIGEATAETDGIRVRVCQECGCEERESFKMPVDENGQEFVAYVDPRIKVEINPNGVRSYSYRLNDDGDCTGVWDLRSWSQLIYIAIMSDGSLDIAYLDANGNRCTGWCSAVIGYGHVFVIGDDGTTWHNWYNFSGEG